MIKILTFSDIHNNISAVQSLRDQEINEYDAIVIAGDIGNYIWPEILAIIDTFDCPAYFVYGNWDSRQPYIRQLSSNGILLNHTVEFHKGYYFTGFSGCETHWGMNPLLTEQVEFINSTYQDEIESNKKEQVDSKIRMGNLIKTVNNTYLGLTQNDFS
jgi:Icc-related predicted phosphoesterase